MTRVLVVEDDPALARALAITLRAYRYEVAVAHSGAAALDAAATLNLAGAFASVGSLTGAGNVLGGGGGLDPSWSTFLGTSIDAAWDKSLHNLAGVLAMGDGSSKKAKTPDLREKISTQLSLTSTNVVFSKPRGVF